MKRQSILVTSVLSLFLLTWWVGYSVIGNIDWSAKKTAQVENRAASVQDAQTGTETNRRQPRRAARAETSVENADDRVFANQGWQIDSTNGTVPKACLNFTAKMNAEDNLKVIDYIRTEPEAKLTAEITGNRLCLTGFDYSQDYSLTILKGLKSADHGALKEDKTLEISFGDRPPFVAFAGNGVISAAYWRARPCHRNRQCRRATNPNFPRR